MQETWETENLSHRFSEIPLAGSNENNLTIYVSEMENPSLIFLSAHCRAHIPLPSPLLFLLLLPAVFLLLLTVPK